MGLFFSQKWQKLHHRVEHVEISFVSTFGAERSLVRPISTLPKFQPFLHCFEKLYGKTKKNCELLPPIRYQITLQHLRFIMSEPRLERSTVPLVSAELTLDSSLGPTERLFSSSKPGLTWFSGLQYFLLLLKW